MKSFSFALAITLSCFATSSFAVQRTKAQRPESQPIFSTVQKGSGSQMNKTFTEPRGVITFADAIMAALSANPTLAAFDREVEAREAEALQSGLHPNPELGAEAENVLGSGSFSGVNDAELTLSIGQLIELGGKRQKRARAAILNADVAAWDYEIVRLEIYQHVLTAFTELLAAQQQIVLQQDLVMVAQEALKSIEHRIEAGRESPAEAARARVELSKTTIALEKMQHQMLALKNNLAATWGSTDAQFDRVEGDLEKLSELPDLQTLQEYIEQNPQVSAWATAVQQRDAELELARAQRIPDPVVEGGLRRLNGSGDHAFVFGLSLPLLLFDRNQGAIEAAEIRRQQAKDQQKAVEIALYNELVGIHAQLAASTLEIEQLRSTVIEDAQNAFDLINQGFKMGKYGFLDVLDAQRTLFEVKSQYVNALSEYHIALAALERLIGRNISQIQ